MIALSGHRLLVAVLDIGGSAIATSVVIHVLRWLTPVLHPNSPWRWPKAGYLLACSLLGVFVVSYLIQLAFG